MDNNSKLENNMMSMDVCICVETGIPFFKDFTSGALYTTGRYASEYHFWLEFFKDSESLLHEFKTRVSDASRGFIRWDFIRPADKLSNQSMAEQYREALNFVKDCLKGSSLCHLQKTRENLRSLEKYASEVISNREAQLEAHKNDGNTRIREVHLEIHRRWVEVLEAIQEAILKAES